jgi:hypothetical protein
MQIVETWCKDVHEVLHSLSTDSALVAVYYGAQA